MSSSNSPCAACKCLRRKCTQECVYAPFFPPDQPEKFVNVHKVFGASNVAKLLNELPASQREDAVNSLAYEAKSRLQDPVYGCVGLIYVLQNRLKQVQTDLYNAKKELATYIGPQAMLPMIQPGFMTPQLNPNHPSSSGMMPFSMQQHPMMGLPTGVSAAANPQLMLRDPNQQQMIDAQAQQMVNLREQQELFRGYEQRQPQQNEQTHAPPPPPPQQQHELMRFTGEFELGSGNTYNQMAAAATTMSPSLALGSYKGVSHNHHIQQQPGAAHEIQLQSQMVLQQQQEPPPLGLQQPQRAKSEEGRSNIGPSC